jgi:hypothetical protein
MRCATLAAANSQVRWTQQTAHSMHHKHTTAQLCTLSVQTRVSLPGCSVASQLRRAGGSVNFRVLATVHVPRIHRTFEVVGLIPVLRDVIEPFLARVVPQAARDLHTNLADSATLGLVHGAGRRTALVREREHGIGGVCESQRAAWQQR